MNEKQEGPVERKFWIFVGAITFAPLAVALGYPFLNAILNIVSGPTRRDPFPHFLGPILFFGLAMIGVSLLLIALVDLAKKRRKVATGWLVVAPLWALYFGWLFLRELGIKI